MSERTETWMVRIGWLLIAALLLSNSPLFICMPLTDDAQYFDIQLRTVWRGGVLYRDCLEPNFPGVHWIHRAVRSVAGWSTEAMSAFDLLCFLVTAWLIFLWVRRAAKSSAIAVWTAFAVLLFYLSISEWNHCQRDGWLLLIGWCGLHLRLRQHDRCTDDAGQVAVPRSVVGWGIVEGLVWGCAVWLKPHVIVPATAVWLLNAISLNRWRRNGFDLTGLLIGGATMGGIGVAWLVASGTWPHFWETLVEWNPQYMKSSYQFWDYRRFGGLWLLFPYAAAHAIALPTALRRVVVTLRGDEMPQHESALLAIFYVSWTAQVFFLQHLFNYVMTPTILLAMAYLTSEAARFRGRIPAVVLSLFFLAALFVSPRENRDDGSTEFSLVPVIQPQRLATWWSCVRLGSTAENRDRLTGEIKPSWRELEAIQEFLRGKEVKDREVLCLSGGLFELYRSLELQPPTRFVYYEQLLIFFPDRVPLLRAELEASPLRFVVADLSGEFKPRGARQVDPGDPLIPPLLARPQTEDELGFPWSSPIVYRAGSIVVFDATNARLDRLVLTAPKRKPGQND